MLLSGRGTYVADLRRPNMAEIAVVRSTVAHGRVTAIRTAEAAALGGVIEVVTAADLTDVSPFPNFAAYVHTPGTFPLAKEKVRYVGAPVAVVLAEDRYIAEDAAELVEVHYDELPAVTDMDAALEADATLLYEDWPDNRMLNLQPDDAEVAAILAGSRVIERRYKIGRHTAMPMETRAALAEVLEGGRLQLWPTNQHAHMARTTLSYVLPIPERDIKVTIPYVGGGFRPEAAPVLRGRPGLVAGPPPRPPGSLRRGPRRAHDRRSACPRPAHHHRGSCRRRRPDPGAAG